MGASLLAILSAAGLAGAAGHRASIPALALGVLHHVAGMTAGGGEPFFALGERFDWLANPGVMGILGVLAIIEVLAEANPDMPELTELALKAPKLAAGFLVVGATVGTMDDSLMLLTTSGVLGAGTALVVDNVRADIKRAIDEPLADATDGGSTKAMALAETGWAAGLSVAAIVVPVAVLGAAGILFFVWKGKSAASKARMIPCPACGEQRHAEATACPHCQAAIA